MAVYYVYSGAAGSNNGTSWANAYTTLTTAFTGKAAGDTFYVAHDHAESTAAAITLTSVGTNTNPSKVVCVNRAGTVPPVAADRLATGQVNTTGASSITLNGCTHWDGIVFTAGNGSTGSAHLIIAGQNTLFHRFDNCSLRLGNSSANVNAIQISTTSSGGSYVELNNTTVSFSHILNTILVIGTIKWRNTPSALLGTIPTILFTPNATMGGFVDCVGVDLSAAGSGKTIAGTVSNAKSVPMQFTDCKLDAAATRSVVPTSYGSTEVDFVRCGASGVNYTVYRHRVTAVLSEETTIVHTGGASDGTTPIAWKIITTANCHYSGPFECPSIAIWNDTTGSAVTATVEGIWGGGAVPLDNEVWLQVEYLGDASSPIGSFVNDGMANLLATAANQTSSSETWGGSTTKFKLAVTFTPQQKGWIYAVVKCAKLSTTFYIDPLVTLT